MRLYALSIGFYTNSLLVKTRVKSTLYTPILYWSGARHWGSVSSIVETGEAGGFAMAIRSFLESAQRPLEEEGRD